jgi:hypothetical protein
MNIHMALMRTTITVTIIRDMGMITAAIAATSLSRM